MPADGMIKPLSEAADEAFANEALGKGCLVIPENGNVYAPFDGTVRVLFPTNMRSGLPVRVDVKRSSTSESIR